MRCLVLVLPCALAVSACRDHETPTRLVNGSPARASPVPLEGVDGTTIGTDVDVIPASRVQPRSAAARCLERVMTDDSIGDVVVRTGVNGRSITVGTASGRALYACDGGAEGGAPDTPWCGDAFARLARGRLLDPRLDLTGCTSPSGKPLAFVWLEPGRDARYVAVQQPGYLEVYPVAGRLPMRIATTTGIDVEGSRASFELSEHDAEGRLLRTCELEARVAG